MLITVQIKTFIHIFFYHLPNRDRACILSVLEAETSVSNIIRFIGIGNVVQNKRSRVT